MKRNDQYVMKFSKFGYAAIVYFRKENTVKKNTKKYKLHNGPFKMFTCFKEMRLVLGRLPPVSKQSTFPLEYKLMKDYDDKLIFIIQGVQGDIFDWAYLKSKRDCPHFVPFLTGPHPINQLQGDFFFFKLEPF